MLFCLHHLSEHSFHCQRNAEIQFWEAEVIKIDDAKNKVFCKSNIDKETRDFSLEYDYLIIAVGAQVNTFGTPGVLENCHFLKVKTLDFIV